ncbi:MAG: hypothetical protein A2Y79_12620 [Deltaproteobacteria bacterium RBG_13_43_22]|nr:MAG: hypothetical protein A2Y79_12620 [Deltaproteobacteria bacterium RBG_13_43_22]
MDYLQITAPCGIDCFNCPMYLAKDNQDLRTKIAQNMGIPSEKAVCQGCRAEKGTIAFLNMTEPCNVYRCIEKKDLDFCGDCSDFPCDHLHPYADMASQRPHNTKVFNLCLIKKMGVDSWGKTKAKDVRDTYFKGKFKL